MLKGKKHIHRICNESTKKNAKNIIMQLSSINIIAVILYIMTTLMAVGLGNQYAAIYNALLKDNQKHNLSWLSAKLLAALNCAGIEFNVGKLLTVMGYHISTS
uniref:Uncharacterized protein n=1 Tax=Glossina austeni TaxID=7395 RepID=A0A1A9VL73_GLOAU